MAENTQPLITGEIQQSLEVSQSSQAEGNVDQGSSQGLPLPVPPIPNQPPSNGHQPQAGNENHNRLDIARFIVEILTLVVLLWYTIITNGLWDVADQANRLNIENSRLDQRAWVVPSEIITPVEIKEEVPLVFGVQVVNSGKTPALELQTVVAGIVWFRGQSFVPDYEDHPLSLPEKSVGTLLTGIPVVANAYPVVLSKRQSDALRNKVTVFYLYGELSYKDVFNNPHCTAFCFVFSPNQRAYACEKYNKITDTKCENIE